MPGSWDVLRTESPAEIGRAAELGGRVYGDLASISDELTDAMQAATCYVEAARRTARTDPPILDKQNREILTLAMAQITRANRAIKYLHGNLIEGSQG